MSTGPAGHELQRAGIIFRVVFGQKSVIFDRSIKRQNFIAGERRRPMGSNQLETALEIASCLRVASSDGLRLPPESPLWYPASGGGLVITFTTKLEVEVEVALSHIVIRIAK